MTEVVTDNEQGMKLRTAFKTYSICLGAFILLVVLAVYSEFEIFGWIAFFFYCGCGVYLNRNVLRRIVEWHPMHSTLDQVSSSKLQQAAFWLIAYLLLFFVWV